ncbi:MAG: aminotransferase class V-fold PLP-dependent enzyme [Deltaproteobacteria bacterium]|nr:aminotransferase class V-fold PLP-dependent enzyme [Deltaproteobacteria bacterium]
MRPKTLYLDHAATCWPRPPAVAAAMTAALEEGGNPGRSGHYRSLDAARMVFGARQAVARHLGVGDPRRVVFTPGCTEGINVVLSGLLEPGGRVVTTAMEHNAAARALRHLAATRGVALEIVAPGPDGRVDPRDLRRAAAGASFAVVNWVSNVSGTVQDLPALREATRGIPLLVDGAQAAGHLPVAVDGLGIDYLAVPGHKGLRGPPGVGVLCLGPGARVPVPLVHGGTGSRSEEDRQPPFLPDALEAGTPNVPGIRGLAAGIAAVEAGGLPALQAREQALCARFLEGLEARALPVRVLGPRDPTLRVAVFGLVPERGDAGTLALRLEREHGVLARAGLHCAPWAHRALGSFPGGALRLSFGPDHGDDAVDEALAALEAVCP